MESKKLIYQGRRIAFYQKKISDAQRNQHIYDCVSHPGAVVILPYLHEKEILLIKNQRIVIEKTLLELPAGTLEKGEDPIDAAFRELEEETGYRAKVIDPLFTFYSSPGFCDEILYIFVAKELYPTAQKLDPTEKITVVPTPLSLALSEIQRGTIQDGKTIATLLYAATFGTSR